MKTASCESKQRNEKSKKIKEEEEMDKSGSRWNIKEQAVGIENRMKRRSLKWSDMLQIMREIRPDLISSLSKQCENQIWTELTAAKQGQWRWWKWLACQKKYTFYYQWDRVKCFWKTFECEKMLWREFKKNNGMIYKCLSEKKVKTLSVSFKEPPRMSGAV